MILVTPVIQGYMTVRSRAMDKTTRQTQKSNLFIWIVKTLLCKEVTKKLLNLREISKLSSKKSKLNCTIIFSLWEF